MHRSRIVILFYSLTGIIAAFLSWVSQTLLNETTYVKGIDSGYSVTKTNIGDGWLTAFCFIVMIAMLLIGKRTSAVSRRKLWWIALFAFVSLIIGLYNILIILIKSKANTGDLLVMKASPGVGLYLTVIVSAIIVSLPFWYKAISGSKGVALAE